MTDTYVPRLTDLLNATSLSDGLTQRKAVKTGPELPVLLRAAGLDQTQVISCTFSELASLDLPDFSTVFVTDIPAGIGSLWMIIGGEWKPVNGIISYKSHAGGTLLQVAYDAEDTTLIDIHVMGGILKPGVFGNFECFISVEDIPEAPIPFIFEIYGKDYDGGAPITYSGIVFSTQTGLPYSYFDARLSSRTMSGDNRIDIIYKNQAGEVGYGLTDIDTTEDWGIKVIPQNPIASSLSPMSVYVFNLSFLFT